MGLILNERARNSRRILSNVSMSLSGSWLPFTIRFALPCTSIPVYTSSVCSQIKDFPHGDGRNRIRNQLIVVLDYNTVNIAQFNVCNQLLKLWTIKCSAAPSSIDVPTRYRKLIFCPHASIIFLWFSMESSPLFPATDNRMYPAVSESGCGSVTA